MKAVHKAIQARVDAIRPKHAGHLDVNSLTDEERRDSLVKRIKQVDEQIMSLPKGSKERKFLGQEKQQLGIEINRIRPKRKARGVECFFIEVCREKMTLLEFDLVMKEAVRRLGVSQNDRP